MSNAALAQTGGLVAGSYSPAFFTLPECETNGIVDHRKAVKSGSFTCRLSGIAEPENDW